MSKLESLLEYVAVVLQAVLRDMYRLFLVDSLHLSMLKLIKSIIERNQQLTKL